MPRQKLILDRYRIVDKAGEGGFATVQHAYDTRLKRDVAIKCIELSASEVARARLLAMEARMQGEGALEESRAGAHGRPDATDAGNASAARGRAGAGGAPDAASADGGQAASGGALGLDAADEARGAGVADGAKGAAASREALPWEEDAAGAFFQGDGADGLDGLASPDGLEAFDGPDAPGDSDGVRLAGYPDDPSFLAAREERLASASPRRDRVDLFASPDPAHLAAQTDLLGASTAGRGLGQGPGSGFETGPDAGFGPDVGLDDADDLDSDELFDHIPGLQEARTAAHLNDSNIVTVYDCEVHGSTAYIVMEYVEGKTLARLMRELGDDISLDMVAAVFSSVAHALEVAHDNDVLHLDIKPENVIVNRKGVVKVADFGLASLVDASGCATAGAGTIGYMPPEQIRQEPLDVRTDEWALASLTYEMLSGSNPFLADRIEDAEELIEDAELVLPSLCWDELSAEADDLMFEALDPDPDERFASVAAFAEELTPLLGNARAGKRALAAAVSEEAEEPVAEQAPREPLPPVIDRLGPRGAAVISRVLAAAGTALMCAVSLVNVRLDPADVYGLASSQPVVFWALMVAAVAFAAWKPAAGAAVGIAAFAAALVINQAYAVAAVLLVGAGAWWWFVGRRNDGAATAFLLQPLLGSVGLAAASPVAAGAVLDVREAAATAAGAAVCAAAFVSLGSGGLLSWNAPLHFFMASNATIGGAHMHENFVAAVTSPATWCVAASWVAAAAAYSLFCLRGTRAFDIAGSAVAAALLVAGVVLGTGAESWLAAGGAGAGVADAAADAAGAVSGAAAWLPDPLALVGAIVPGAVGIALAVMAVPDRVRLAEGEW